MTQAIHEQKDQVTRVALTQMPPSHPFITNPVPVGVAGFALTTFMLGLYTSGQFSAKYYSCGFTLSARSLSVRDHCGI